MDAVSSPPTDEQAPGRARAWLSRQPEWIAQIIAVAVTWACVLLCVLSVVLAIQALGG